ncbi:TetR/AcrR family transcriptional regulator [Cryptosporangium aurantiacum]|uniref:Transcriptional regulator, TetR family n=1 Tax=Cryptosporangium aurantiacum TaxID=134849 RepID=A0A1M7RJZ9_9ACTN|nr:TetR/AcrR family transcriptional regulator [Cryptosporangium aurantiacum]SHN46643.1 transcriptional regulator, TetR family [Cryptosporangium aurantiacum]
MPTQRRPRADAQRNAERLLAAAEDAFRRDGTDASLERIARAAGVAVGTLYGHFPRREALIAAVLRTRHDALFGHGETLLAEQPPAEALRSWVRACSVHAATYRGLAELLAAGPGDAASELHGDCARMADLTHRIAAAARRAGALDATVTDDDLTTLMNAAAWTHGQSEQQSERLIDATLRGMVGRVTA